MYFRIVTFQFLSKKAKLPILIGKLLTFWHFDAWNACISSYEGLRPSLYNVKLLKFYRNVFDNLYSIKGFALYHYRKCLNFLEQTIVSSVNFGIFFEVNRRSKTFVDLRLHRKCFIFKANIIEIMHFNQSFVMEMLQFPSVYISMMCTSLISHSFTQLHNGAA